MPGRQRGNFGCALEGRRTRKGVVGKRQPDLLPLRSFDEQMAGRVLRLRASRR